MNRTTRSEGYVAGQCNIGAPEIRKRKRIGFIGATLSLLFIILSEWLDIPQVYKLGLFAPTVYAATGFLQARQQFCLLYGLAGVSHTGEKRAAVRDKASRNLDRRKALAIIVNATLLSAAVTMAYFFLS